MSHSTKPGRFHALDAARAFALLLGVVFHAAWSFGAAPCDAVIMDLSAGQRFSWFSFTAHTFRMQLFFLIAGFFGHLLYHRRGFAGFARHRLLRVGGPLLVGWLVLYPLYIATFVAGWNVSGRNLVEMPLAQLLKFMFGYGLLLIPQSMGGVFGLGHLWFLYYLLWLYAMTLGLRFLLTRSESIGTYVRGWMDSWVRQVMKSPGYILPLTAGTALLLWQLKGWFGVETPHSSLQPVASSLMIYGTFFVLGWLLHRQADLLSGLGRHWRWQLPLGLILSIPLFLAFRAAQHQGLAGSELNHYPKLDATQFTDWPTFLARLRAAERPETVPVELANLWQRFPAEAQAAIGRMTGNSPSIQRAGVADALNRLLVQPAMFGTELIPVWPLPPADVGHQAIVENRATLEKLFGQSLVSNPQALSWYRPAKLAYSMGYAFVMWLLCFGALGFFQAHFTGHSPAWRYVADSSYWIYLVHIPVVPVLQIWMAPWPWPGLIKLLLLNLIAFVILFASYHYFVRSTFLGRLLNGQSYPLVAWSEVGAFLQHSADPKTRTM